MTHSGLNGGGSKGDGLNGEAEHADDVNDYIRHRGGILSGKQGSLLLAQFNNIEKITKNGGIIENESTRLKHTQNTLNHIRKSVGFDR